MALTSITKDFIVKSGLIVGTTATIKGDATLKAGLRVEGISTLTGALFASDTLTVTKDTTLSQGLAVTGISTLTGAVYAGSTLQVTNDTTLSQGLAVTGISTLTGAVYASSTVNSAGQFSVATNKFIVDTSGNVYAAGNVGVVGNLATTGTIVNVNTTDVTAAVNTTTAAVSIQAGGLYVNKSIWSDSATAASVGNNGALVLQYGGAYIGNNLYVNSTASNTGTLASNAIYVAGGVGIAGGLAVSQDAVFKGNVFFQGETTYSLSTNTVYTDNILELHVNGSVDTPWAFDDGKDIGARFHYYDGADKNAAFVLANDTKWFEFYKDGTEIGGVFSSVNYATLKAGSLILDDATTSTDYQSGALIVKGGVGVGGDIYLNTGKLHGTATQADNLNGGSALQIPYQTAAGVTSFIAAPAMTDNLVLTYTIADGFAWGAASGTTVGTATNADNVAIGLASGGTYYPTLVSATGAYEALDANTDLSYNVDTGTLSATIFSGAGTDLTGTASSLSIGGNAGTVTDGVYTTGSYSNPTWITAIDYNILNGIVPTWNQDTTGTATYANNLSGGAANEIPYQSGAGSTTFSSNLTFDGTSLAVGGSGGNITMSGGGNISGATDITGSGTVQGGHLKDTSLTTTGGVVYSDGFGQLSNDSSFTYASSTLTTPNIVASSTTDTTGSSDGALVVDGGAYVAKRLFVNGDTGARILADGAGGGALAVYGGLDVNNNIFADGGVATNGGTETKPDLGSAGGAYIGKDLYVGTTATINGDLFVDGTIFVKGSELSGLDQITGSTGTFVNITSTGTITANAITANSLTVNGQAAITTATIGNFANGTQITAGPAIGVGSVTNGYTTTYTISNLGVQSAAAGTGIALSGSTGSVTITNIGVTTLNNLTGTVSISAGTGITVDSTSTLGVVSISSTYVASDTLQTVTDRGNLTSNIINITNSSDNGYGYGQSVNSNTASWALYTAGGIGAVKNITAGGVVSAGDMTAADGADTGSVDTFYAVNNMQAARTVKNISGNTTVTIDSWATATYTSAKYMVQIVDGGSVYVSEIMIMQVSGNAYISEYGIVNNLGDLGEFNVTQSGSNLVLEYTPTSATSMTIQVVRQSILTAVETFC